MVAEISRLERSDTPEVAALFMRVFRNRTSAPPQSLQSYLIDLYIENPWIRDCIAPLVLKSSKGKVIGFIGVVPRPFIFQDKPIMAATVGSFMVDPEQTHPLSAVGLVRKLLEGPQELTISDTANDTSRRLWKGARGTTLPLYSIRWIRLLRPFRFLIFISDHRLRHLLKPFAWVGDQVARPLFEPLIGKGRQLQVEQLDADFLTTGFEDLAERRLLRPVYDRRGSSWLLSMAARKTQCGNLHKNVVIHDRKWCGWYLYYTKPGSIGYVLKLFARQGFFREVFGSLCLHAYGQESVALTGLLDPQHLYDLSKEKCFFYQRGTFTLAYSRNQTILDAFHRGDAEFSHLEGDFWTSLGDEFR